MRCTGIPVLWLAFALSLGPLAGCSSPGGAAGDGGGEAENGDFPQQPIRWVVASSAGGGFDTATRQFAPHFEQALGGTFRIDNLPGGNVAVAAGVLARDGGDCYTIMTSGIPHLLFSFMTQPVPYSYESFHPLGRLTTEPGLIRVRTDAPWRTIGELVDDARRRPRGIRMSVSGYTSSNYLGVLELQQAMDVEFNIIPYPGGNQARTALLAGEVDAAHVGVFNSLHIADGSRVLAVHQEENAWPDQTNGAPTLNAELGTDLEPNSSSYGLFVSRECHEGHPDRYLRLTEALQRAANTGAYLDRLEEVGEGGRPSFADAAAYDAEIRAEMDRLTGVIEKYDALRQQP